jgi:hypothetical protein
VAPVALFVYVEDVDDVFDRAIEAGAGRSVERPDDLFAEDDWSTVGWPTSSSGSLSATGAAS